MSRRCNVTGMMFGRTGGRQLVAEFDGELVTSDAGALLLGGTDQAIGLVVGSPPALARVAIGPL
jgi:hypothetical protein